MADGPIQVVLNPADFREQRRKPQGGGGGKDFYQGADEAFAAHRDGLAHALADVIRPAERVNVFVRMRPDALAKSHRPFGALFTSRRATHVGTVGWGELIFATTPTAVAEIVRVIRGAEEVVAWRPNAAGVLEYAPTRARSEVGAIASLSEWKPSEHRGFSLDDAEDWLSSQGAGARLEVELLDLPDRSAARGALREEALREIEALMGARPVLTGAARLILPGGAGAARGALTGRGSERAQLAGELRDLLPVFEASGVVKRVRLPDAIEGIDPVENLHSSAGRATTPAAPDDAGTVPAVVGMVDGGVSGPLASSVVGRVDLIADEHRSVENANHASQVASLLMLGSSINRGLLTRDEDCRVYDMGLFPSWEAIAHYFPSVQDFFDQLRSEVRRAKDVFGVRIFNLSWNLRAAPGSRDYTLAARELDEIALEMDVIFVVSAGNLAAVEQRPEWPPSDSEALAMLASIAGADGIAPPAESLANFGIGAVNPPNLPKEIEGAPTRYTRRGGRMSSALKPDLAAVGGAAPDGSSAPTGVRGFDSFGNLIHVRGTSFAAPIVSRYLASLDSAIRGDVPRELLIALAVHHADMPPILSRPAFRNIASSFVGYGVPGSVSDTLEGFAHQMTLVLADTLEPGRRVDFPFTWPSSLTDAKGRCRGRVHMTLVSRPELNYVHGSERVRVNLEAGLQQAASDGSYRGRVTATHQFFSGFTYANERTLAGELGKWSPIKSYKRTMPRGAGESSDWRIDLNYLTRADESFPERGTPFALVLTIEDHEGAAPVFDEMRRSLGTIGVQLNDLRTALSVSTRV